MPPIQMSAPDVPSLAATAWCSLALALACGLLAPLAAAAAARTDSKAELAGIVFECAAADLPQIETRMAAYLAEQDILPAWLVRTEDRDQGRVSYTLATPPNDRSTLDLASRPAYRIGLAALDLPAGTNQTRRISTVSQKEILLALMQHGRQTRFSGRACTVAALREHVGIRQNVVAWAEVLEWDWPNGDRARWNPKYWRRGTPVRGFPLHEAVNDLFVRQEQYGIGCYTATKLVMLQGVLDYYRRVSPDPRKLAMLEARLALGGEPLEDVEPGSMWQFETDYDPDKRRRPGKLLRIAHGIASQNFIPGDWSYLQNTDPGSDEKTGYEGSNAVYLGRGRFDDYYNDNNHSYDFQQKLDEVYQWRNGVFSRSRDFAKLQPLGPADFERLRAPPALGGLLNDFRVFPYLFGYEKLPELVRHD